MNQNLLIIFVKNPEAGKVKTRLAASVGDLNALHIYKSLLSKTRNVASQTDAVRQVWYSSFIDQTDKWNSEIFQKKKQKGSNLGERMANAFRQGFENQFNKIVIIGSDCPDLTPAHINRAFDALGQHDAVIGPSKDGGYYLLGLSRFMNELFVDKDWSTSSVFEQTTDTLEKHNRSLRLLEVLNDVDTVDDLKKSNLTLPHFD